MFMMDKNMTSDEIVKKFEQNTESTLAKTIQTRTRCLDVRKEQIIDLLLRSGFNKLLQVLLAIECMVQTICTNAHDRLM
jgi:hypothetical protein